MNILITNSKSGAFFEIATGWKNAFVAGGHKAELWNGDDKTWHDWKPQLFIGCSGIRQKFDHLRSKFGTKLVIHVNPYCDEIIQVPGGPLINDSPNAIAWVKAQRPDAIIGYGLQEDVDRWWTKWPYIKIGMANAADVERYRPIKSTPKFECDLGWVGGHWGYKAQNLDKYLVPAMKKFNGAWYGWSGPKGMWKGKIEQADVLNLFNSAKVCPSIVEPHTTKYGIDVPERVFKVTACGAVSVSDPWMGSERFFKSLPIANDAAAYSNICSTFISMDRRDRREMGRLLMIETLSENTYYHRVQNMFRMLGFMREADVYDLIIEDKKKIRLAEFDALT